MSNFDAKKFIIIYDYIHYSLPPIHVHCTVDYTKRSHNYIFWIFTKSENQYFKGPAGSSSIYIYKPWIYTCVDSVIVITKKKNVFSFINIIEIFDIQVYRWILHHIVLYASRFKNKWPLPWHPSDMVFSRCKADATWNKKSKPEYNSFGKYWLKLFFMVSSTHT